MNHIYKVVRCAKTGVFKAVPEFSRSKGKSSKATVGVLALISAITFSPMAQAVVEGIQTGTNDLAIGQQATSTGQNNIAIGQGSFAAGGTLSEAEANKLIADSRNKINQIGNTQQTIAQKEAAIAQYLVTVDKVERNQAEIDRLTVLNNAEKSKTNGLTSEFNTANGIYTTKQAEVDTKVGYLEKLDLNAYGALDETGLEKIATDVQTFIEKGDNTNSLGLDFYKGYVNAYVEKVAKLDYTKSLSSAAANFNSFYLESSQTSVNPKVLLGDAAKTETLNLSLAAIPVTSIEVINKNLADLTADRDYYRANKDDILNAVIDTNSQVEGMYGGENKEVLDGYMESFYEYKSNQLKLYVLQKQTGVMDGTEPDYLAKVNETKALKSRNQALESQTFKYSGNRAALHLEQNRNAATFLSVVARDDNGVYSADLINSIANADTEQANQLQTYLTDQIAVVKKRSEDAEKALTANQQTIANFELNIKNRQPTAEELLAYNKAKAEEALLNEQRDALVKQTEELKAIQAGLNEGKDAVAMGANSKAIGDGAVALGANNDVLAAGAVGLGTENSVTGAESIAIGTGNTVSGTNSIAVGTGHTITGNNSGSFGDPNVVSGDNSYVYGNDNMLSGNNSHVIGNNNNVSSNGSFVFGNNVALTAAATDSIIIGSDASSIVAGGIAIGNGSIANRENSVSVGRVDAERQVINVAAGTANTDAVNLGQLNTGLAGKADIGYVDSQNTSQNLVITQNTTAISSKANQSDLNTTNQVITDNKTAQATTDADQDAITAANKQEAAAANATTNQVIADNKTAQATTDAGQDGLIATNKQEAATANAATNQVVADNKTAQATTDAGQDAVTAANKQEAAAANATTNQVIADNKIAQASTDAGQDSLIAANKLDTDTKITETNDRVTNEASRQDGINADQNTLITQNTQTITVNKQEAAAANAANNQVVTDNKAEQTITDAGQDAVTAANKQEATTANAATNDRITN